MKSKMLVGLIAVLFIFLISGCRNSDPQKAEKPDISWQHVKFDSPDYFYEEDFIPSSSYPQPYMAIEFKKNAVEKTANVKKTIKMLEENGMLSEHPLVFDPGISKDIKSNVDGSWSGNTLVGGTGGGFSGSISGESEPELYVYFCWKLNNSDKRRMLTILPADDIVWVVDDNVVAPTIRFKYKVDQEPSNPYPWVLENPNSLVSSNLIFHATIRISHDQLSKGYYGIR